MTSFALSCRPISTSARQARAAVRQALAAWGMNDPSGDAELLASELAANAAEHGRGPISLALRRQAAQDGQPAIACEITDTSPDLPRQHQAGPEEERGRGMAIVTALATDAGTGPPAAARPPGSPSPSPTTPPCTPRRNPRPRPEHDHPPAGRGHQDDPVSQNPATARPGAAACREPGTGLRDRALGQSRAAGQRPRTAPVPRRGTRSRTRRRSRLARDPELEAEP